MLPSRDELDTSASNPRSHEGSRDGLLVSVITPVRDAVEQVRMLLAALEGQTLPPSQFEIILSDDGSSSPEVRHLATSDGHVRVLEGPRLNSYAARNRAVAAAKAPVIAACDADCRPEPDWLERGLADLKHEEIVAGLIRFVVPERLSVWGLLDMDTFLDQERAVKSGYGVTANLFFPRELFERVGGFDDSQPNQGDYDFVRRSVAAGAQLRFAPDAVVWHPTRNSRREYLRKVWVVNARYAEREAQAGRKPEGLKLRSWVPVVQTARGRLRVGRTIRLDRRRLAGNGVRPRPWDDLRSLPIMYLLIPYIGGFAQLRGWLAGRKHRGEGQSLTGTRAAQDRAT